MKKTMSLFALVLSVVLAFSVLTSCDTGNDPFEGDVTPSPVPTNINDAPATTEYIAKVAGVEIYTNVFKYYLYDALMNVDFSGLEIPEGTGDDDAYNMRIDYLYTEKSPGVTFLQAAAQEALDYCHKFTVCEVLAKNAGIDLTDEEKQSYYDSVDSTADRFLSTYGESEGASTRDEIIQIAVGMNVNEYKRFYISQIIVSDYSDAEKEKLTPTDEELLAYYNENQDLYRVVTVRKFLVTYETEDEDGKELPEDVVAANREEARALAEKYIKLIEENDLDLGKFSKGFSAEVENTNMGLLDITSSGTYDKYLTEWAVAQEGPTDNMVLVETNDGFYGVRCEGVTTYSQTSPVTLGSTVSAESIQSSVLSAVKTKLFEELIGNYCQEEQYKLTDVNNELIDKLANDYVENELKG